MKNGKVTIDGVEVQEGWLKISKQFNDKYAKNDTFGCDSSLDMSVMLNMVLDENLKMKGMAREIVNKVQKLRKAVGLHIDDHVEVFYKVESGEDSQLSRVVSQNLD